MRTRRKRTALKWKTEKFYIGYSTDKDLIAVNEMDVRITGDELAILSTAIAIVQKHGERMRGKVLCSDGKLRSLTQEQAIDLIDRMSQLAGYKPGELKEQGLALAKKVKH